MELNIKLLCGFHIHTSSLRRERPARWPKVHAALILATVTYRSWIDFLFIIQSEEQSNESEFYVILMFQFTKVPTYDITG